MALTQISTRPYRNDVAASVRAHFAVRGLRDSAVARMVGMSQSALSRRTNGDAPFDVDELDMIAQQFGITVPQLLVMPTADMVATPPKGQTTD